MSVTESLSGRMSNREPFTDSEGVMHERKKRKEIKHIALFLSYEIKIFD
jgi:hypothetical protein